MAFEGLLNNQFTISRRDRVSDGQGGWTIVWADVATVRGRIRPANSAERVVADKDEQQVTHVLYVVAGEDIARGDLVACLGPEGVHELEVEVLGIREPSQAGHHWEIDCLERQPEVMGEIGS